MKALSVFFGVHVRTGGTGERGAFLPEAKPVPSKDLLSLIAPSRYSDLPPAYISKINGMISIEIITCHIHMQKGDILFTVDFAVHNELMNVLQMQMNQQRKARFQPKEIIV